MHIKYTVRADEIICRYVMVFSVPSDTDLVVRFLVISWIELVSLLQGITFRPVLKTTILNMPTQTTRRDRCVPNVASNLVDHRLLQISTRRLNRICRQRSNPFRLLIIRGCIYRGIDCRNSTSMLGTSRRGLTWGIVWKRTGLRRRIQGIKSHG